MRRAALAIGVAATVVLGLAARGAAAPDEPVVRAGRYLVAMQHSDGSWGDSATPVAADLVAYGVVGLVSAGIADASLTTAVNYVAAHGPSDANRAPATARVILAAVAAGKDPRDFGKVDYVRRLATYYNPTTGSYDSSTDANSLAILAIVAAKAKIPPEAIAAQQGRHCDDGGFPRTTCILGSEVATTALALNALIAAGVGRGEPSVANARTYLLRTQNKDGGFGGTSGDATAALPTGGAIGAIYALGEDATGPPWQKSATADPVLALLALQNSTGGFRSDASTSDADVFLTARVLPGLDGRALPVRPAPAEAAPASVLGGVVTTTGPVSSRVRPPTTVKGRGSRPQAGNTSATTSAPSSVPTAERALAAPPRRTNENGRSLIAVLPFVATLFGAGAIGIALRRRART